MSLKKSLLFYGHDTPVARACISYTKTPNCLCVVLILYLVWMCAGGASSCPPYKCLRTFLHKSLLWLPQLRNPDNPDHILENAAADKIRNYRDTYRRNRHVAFLPACMSTSGRILGELLRLIFFLSHQKGGRLFCGPWLSAAQTRGLSPSRRFLLAKQVLHQDGMCSGCGFA